MERRCQSHRLCPAGAHSGGCGMSACWVLPWTTIHHLNCTLESHRVLSHTFGGQTTLWDNQIGICGVGQCNCFHSSSRDSYVNPRLRTTALVSLLLQVWSVDQQHGPHLGACQKYRLLALPQTHCIFRRSSHNSYCPFRQPGNKVSQKRGKKQSIFFVLI